MKVKKLLIDKLSKGIMVGALSLLGFTTQAQVFVTVDDLSATDDLSKWRSFRNIFDNDGAFENDQPLTYLWGDQWVSFEELKSVLNTSESTIALYPNYSLYNEADPYWADGNGNGNKIFEGLTFVERTDLAGQTIVFSGTTVSSTLVSDYHDTAFIKVLNPANNWETEASVVVDLVPGEDFTLSTGDFVIGAGRYVQYGFSVIGLNGNPAQESTNGFTVVTSAEPSDNPTVPGDVTPNPDPEPGSTTVMLDASDEANLSVYANWFELDGTTYINGNTWGIDDLKTEVDAENNTLILYPNFSTYGDPAFTNGDTGAVIFEGNTYMQDDALITDDVTFIGHCNSNTLTEDYDAVAFIKVFDGGYGLVNYTHVPLVGGEDFTVHVNIAEVASAAHVQYGYSVTGLNANPTQMEALGNAVVTGTTAGTTAFAKKATTLYPNPVNNILNIAAYDVINTIEVYNLMGQKVMTATPNQNNATVNVSTLTSGVYIVNAVVNGKVSTSRFVKQ